MPSNNAAYLIGPKKPLQVRPAPYPVPGASEILIRTHAVAINPLEWLKVDMGSFLYSHIKYPFIFGTDCAGEVVSVGPDVTRFKTGDRVLGCAQGMDERFNRSDMGAFQNYTVLLECMTAPIPDGMTYESASVLPLGLSTAACGLFQEDQLGLPLPSLSPKPSGKTLLVWGGATSVGSNAIQLAVAAGCEVFTSCSPKNFTYVKNLGASQAFDYSSPTVVADILHAFEGKTTAGAFTVGSGSADLAFEIISKCTGNKFISMADYPVPRPLPEFLAIPRVIWGFASWNVKWWVKTKLHGVKGNFIFGSTLVFNGLGKSMFEDFLPMALAKGVYVAAPEPIVVGKGLEAIEEGLNIQRRGVSAKKVVVSL